MDKNNIVLIVLILALGIGVVAWMKREKFTNKSESAPITQQSPPLQQMPPPETPKPIKPSVIDPDNAIKNYEEALAQSKIDHKNLFLFFSGPTCPACKEMKTKTFTDPKVVENLGRYIFVEIYINKNNKSITQKYSVAKRGVIPVYAVVDENETVLKDGIGYRTPVLFNNWLGKN